jgi:hypothetical protein
MTPSQYRSLRRIVLLGVVVNVLINYNINIATALLPPEIKAPAWVPWTTLGILILISLWLTNRQFALEHTSGSVPKQARRRFSKTSILWVGTALLVVVAIALIVLPKIAPSTAAVIMPSLSPGQVITSPPSTFYPEQRDAVSPVASLILMIVSCALVYFELSWEYLKYGASLKHGCLARAFTLVVLPLALAAALSKRSEDQIKYNEGIRTTDLTPPPDMSTPDIYIHAPSGQEPAHFNPDIKVATTLVELLKKYGVSPSFIKGPDLKPKEKEDEDH